MKKIYFAICFCFGSIALTAQTVVSCSIGGNMLTVINSNNNDTIISPNTQELWQAYSISEHPLTSVAPVISMQTVSNGCNIIYSFYNASAANASLGKIQLGGIRFGQYIKDRDFTETGNERLQNHNNNSFSTNSNVAYPKDLFSPLMLLNDTVKGYTICLSLLYPLLSYKHNVNAVLSSSNFTQGGRNWTSTFSLNKYYSDSIGYSALGDLRPGESRTYTLCLRVISNINNCEKWQGGFQTYKDYFRKLYGTVQYTLDKRPINWHPTSNQNCTATNPYGFDGDSTLRPDLVGYGPFTHHIINDHYSALNYRRLIIVRPTGKLMNNPQLNFPFKFTSHWLEGDTNLFSHSYGHQMGDAVDSLQLIPSANRQLGLCWGRSSQIMFDWDTSYVIPLNPYNIVCTNAAYKELQLAVNTGAGLIALDWFKSDCQQEKGVVWLKMMADSAPGVKFYTERWGADILQTLSGMYALDQDSGLSGHITCPHYLADFLLPNSEKAVIIRNTEYPTKALRMSRMSELNNWGYVAMSNIDTLQNPFLATDSWLNNPFPDLGVDTIMCMDSIILHAECKDAINYLWSTGASGSSISVYGPGIYFVEITNSEGCTFSDTIQLKVCNTGMSDFYSTNPLVRIYPNPFTNFVSIHVNTIESPVYSIIVYNIFGQELRRIKNIIEPEYLLYKNGLNAGLYLIAVYDQNHRIAVKKIIAE